MLSSYQCLRKLVNALTVIRLAGNSIFLDGHAIFWNGGVSVSGRFVRKCLTFLELQVPFRRDHRFVLTVRKLRLLNVF
jgi:hypothetical protein